MSTISPQYVDFILLVIPAVSGISKNTEDYLNYCNFFLYKIFLLANSMKIPIITIFTKCDLISDEEIVDCIKLFKQTLKKFNINKNPIIIRNNEDAELFSRNIYEKIIPIFTITNLKWEGLNLFKRFLANLSKIEEKEENKTDEKLEFDIHETLVIENKVIVSGIVNKGIVRTNSKYFLGPYNDGSFKKVEILNIHCKKIPVKAVSKGQYCSLWIKSDLGIKREDLRKGMVLLDLEINPKATRVFEADIWTIDGTRKSLKSKYQPVVNIKHIRQECRIVEFRNKHTGNKNTSSNNLINSLNNNTNKNKIDFNELNKEINLTNIHPLKILQNLNVNNLEHNINNLKISENLNKNLINVENNSYSLEDNITCPSPIAINNNNNIYNAFVEKNLFNPLKPELNIYHKKISGKKKSLNKKSFGNKEEAKNQHSQKEIKPKRLSISAKEEINFNKFSNIKSDTELININEDLINEYENLKPNLINYENNLNQENKLEETYIISPNNNCTVVFEFMYYPEYISEEANILINDQLIKAHGIVKKLLM